MLLQTTGVQPLKAFSAIGATAMLTGQDAHIEWGTDPVIIADGLSAEVNDLCAGNVELIIIVAAVLATPDRKPRTRMVGVIGAIALIAVVNPLRIGIVLWSALAQSLETADLLHDLLFRATLLVTIAGYYYVWYTRPEN